MAATKAASTLLVSTSNAAGATTNSSSINLQTSYGATLTGTMTNGGTSPTNPCVATCQVSQDNSVWDTWDAVTASTSTTQPATSFAFLVPMHVYYARVQFTGNTGQAVTVVCREMHTTGI